ncbi:MAG TPA: hypothetical protein VM367_06640 [Pseudonocardia sp.]|jgi:hypothetical protein|nr:hypothetical protein [Pseudonocardia sp.]
MTAATEQYVDIAKRSQEAVTTAVRTWADSMQSFVTGATGGQPKLPDAHAVVDTYFDFAQQVLDNQRRFAQVLVSSGAQAAEAVTEQAARAAESVTAHATNAAEATVHAGSDVNGEAARAANANARAAKGAAKS